MVQTRDRTTPATESLLTLTEFLEYPETEPASEFIDGEILQKPMPKGKHSYLQLGLAAIIDAALRKARIARPGTELRCTFGDRSIVPDIAVFKWDNIPRDEDGQVADMFDRAPDWTIEILSPDQSLLRPTKNIFHCLEHGCAMGWLIVPEEMSVLVYAPDGAWCFDKPSDRLPVPGFAGDLEITIQDLVDCLQD